MNTRIRPVTAEDWPEVKELRLAALQDPLAAIAFLDTYEQAAARPDEFWQQRAAGTGGGLISRQFVAEQSDGRWVGSVSVLIEQAGGADVFGGPVAQDQAHLVGVFVRPECRGTGVARELFEAATAFARGYGEPPISRVRLFVHQDNHRAEAFYRKLGFARTGHTVQVPSDTAKVENELVLA
ncbi:GNAT family N-acetyltransferase [Streptomyces tateyamensis]|uniref:GNAT family N-acetyltransferase n=1 Tax=Streptomyces tateyamensis TaxID=565073 RepID=A0A2V4PR15_9ACTN|nr:GNAT family N-acetyltransferase [Streptomyces tateyamensis]PYC87397.1 GNAT family N-acetyltransferase [Streptomyces tateyamensis]